MKEKSEQWWDRYLKISTIKFDDKDADEYRYGYEPTPYPVLDLIVDHGYLKKDNYLLDYGCGKGRVVFYLTYFSKCSAIGLDYNERILKCAYENKTTALSGKRVQFLFSQAEFFDLPAGVDRCFFFNPFSIQIFRKVYAKILESWYENRREILLIFYYISDDYLDYIYENTDLHLVEEIDCRNFPVGDPRREKLIIFSLY